MPSKITIKQNFAHMLVVNVKICQFKLGVKDASIYSG